MYFKSVGAKRFLRPVLVIAVFALLMAGFVAGVARFGADTVDRQRESLEKAIVRNIAECYALEGVYPPSLAYMKEHYGLTYDGARFFVDYRPIGGNLYPDYYVTTLE